jgi:hypothetical protein
MDDGWSDRAPGLDAEKRWVAAGALALQELASRRPVTVSGHHPRAVTCCQCCGVEKLQARSWRSARHHACQIGQP